jgi:hypothetical protein
MLGARCAPSSSTPEGRSSKTVIPSLRDLHRRGRVAHSSAERASSCPSGVERLLLGVRGRIRRP